jgi:ABC-type Zn uptake system ZnuABC Zn-binding protein ZnuA
MRKQFILVTVLFYILISFAGCTAVDLPVNGEFASSDTLSEENLLLVVATIPPLQAFVDYIGRDTVRSYL